MVVEVPPGPPVLSPIVAEIYGPDYDGQMRVAKRVRAQFGSTPDITGITDTVDANAPRFVLRVLQNKAALSGVAQKDIVETMRMGLSGEYVTPIHSGEAKYEIPVRLTLPPERQSAIDELLKLTVRSRDGELVPLSELVQVVQSDREKTIYHKDLVPVVYVMGDMGGKLDSPLYGMFDIRSRIAGMSLPEGGDAHGALHPPAGGPLSALRLQVGRRVAGDLRDVPRHGHRLRGGAGADLSAGGGAVPLLPDAADHHGADSADDHRRDAGPCAAGCAVHRDLHDRHDRAGRHHRAQLDPAGGFRRIRSWPRERAWKTRWSARPRRAPSRSC